MSFPAAPNRSLFWFLLLLLAVTLPCRGQQVSSMAVTNGARAPQISITAGQRMEFVSLEPLLSYEQSEVDSSATTRRGAPAIRETDTAVRNAGPQWEVIYLAGSGTSTRLVISSDTVRTNTVSTVVPGDEQTLITSTRTTLRKALPDVIVGPASFRIFPQAGQVFMLNFRLRTNN